MHYNTYGELLDACTKCKTMEEAKEVLSKYKEDNPEYAEKNIGYLLGYVSDESERRRLYALFDTCIHPVFGPTFGR